ncbi:hypothetical protein LCGC14_2546920 [marine sediment metagenome]|uniref:Uncharacterized protein n=1 Tax=marine sediment metagenome TaxID=412755 RepID=A0A0F9DH57_9ZZZZ
MANIGKGIGTIGIWLGPALACWATEEPFVALAFFASFAATVVMWATD